MEIWKIIGYNAAGEEVFVHTGNLPITVQPGDEIEFTFNFTAGGE